MHKELLANVDWFEEIKTFIVSTGDFSVNIDNSTNRVTYKDKFGKILLLEKDTYNSSAYIKFVYFDKYTQDDEAKPIYELDGFPISDELKYMDKYDTSVLVKSTFVGNFKAGCCASIEVNMNDKNKLFINYVDNEFTIVCEYMYESIDTFTNLYAFGEVYVDNMGYCPFTLTQNTVYARVLNCNTGDTEDEMHRFPHSVVSINVWSHADYVDDIGHMVQSLTEDEFAYIRYFNNPPQSNERFTGIKYSAKPAREHIEIIGYNSLSLDNTDDIRHRYAHSWLPTGVYERYSTNKRGMFNNTLNGESLLLPINIYNRRDPYISGVYSMYSYVARFTSIYFTDMYNCSSGSEIVSNWLDGTNRTYKLFTFNARRSPYRSTHCTLGNFDNGNDMDNPTDYSGYMGYAIKL